MESIAVAKISSKGQVVLPKVIREKFEGNDVVFLEEGDEIILKKSSEVLEDLAYLKFQKNTFKELDYYQSHKEEFQGVCEDDFIDYLESKVQK